jgi:TolA-binding protein
MTRSGDRCPDNLLARSRRGPLSVIERRALDAHLGGCDLCRSAVVLGEIYDGAPDQPQPEDEAVIARLASQVVGPPSSHRFRPSLAGVAAALALLAVAGGAAAWVVTSLPRASAPRGAASISQPAVIRPHISTPAVPPSESPSEPTADFPTPKRIDPRAEASSAPAVGDHRHALHKAALPRAPGSGTVLTGPPELFAAANAARRAGDLRGAIARYLLLERRYPTSSEAGVSRVSAGDLLLRLREPRAALEQYDGYLAARGSELLAPEALFGRARCLQALGRNDDERVAWEELGRRFPGSVFEPFGRRRLDELGP